MSDILQELNQPIPMLTPFGKGRARFIWASDGLVWYGVFQDETGENWWWMNTEIRELPSISDGHYVMSPIILSPEREAALAPHRARYKTEKKREAT